MVSDADTVFEQTDLVQQLHHLGITPGGTLVVHCSFRAIHPVRNGPKGLVKSLMEAIGPMGTLVMPSMTDWDDDQVFDPHVTPCRNLGVVADAFWRLPGVLRSDSPHSFAAYGPHATEITRPHPPDIPHGPDSPIGRVYELDGQVLLLGVGHSANTTIHLAEFLAEVPYRVPKYCTVLHNGIPTRVEYGEIDHCCRGFDLVDHWLTQRGVQRTGRIGNAPAILARSRDIVDTAIGELAIDRCRFLCERHSGCEECETAWASVSW
jgi:aminoglycoside 3-N-acetyltransferase